MMHIDMKKVMTYVGAIGAAVTCFIMVLFEVINMHVPALAMFAFSMFMLTYLIGENSRKKAKM